MSDQWTLVLATAVCAGALLSWELPLLVGLVAVAVALLARWSALLVVGGFVLASALAVRAEAGLVPPRSSHVDAEVTLVGDPTPAYGAVRVEVRLGRRRVEAWARGQAADALSGRLAGERIVLRGALRAPPPTVKARLARRHIAAQLNITEVGPWRVGHAVSQLANGLRRTLASGAESLGDERRALFTGMVIGDDREQSVATADDFRGSGLTHLLAVSGQNVAFVLALARPALLRLRFGPRLFTTLALLGFFALLTRFEPSVLRATTMAGLVATAAWAGRPASRLRVLALAVAGLVLVDPLLVTSVGFRLSVGATAGIALLAGPLSRSLPGPRWLAEVLAVTLAAQVGVAPVLIPMFGGVPLASVPANLLAVPAAGPLMGWGLTAGLLAGLAGPPVSGVLHLPTQVLVGWVATVAGWGAHLPLGQIGATEALALAGVVGVGGVTALVRPRWRSFLGPGVAIAALLVLLATAARPSVSDAHQVDLGRGAALWRSSGAAVVVLEDAAPATLLDRLRRQDVRRIDVLVLPRGNKQVAGTVVVLRSRVEVRLVLAPQGHSVRDAVVPALGKVAVGGLVLTVSETTPRLEVAVERAPDPLAGSPVGRARSP